MKIDLNTLSELAGLLESERKRQKLTRAQAAAVCNVSPSFIRDAETQPERCTLGKLVQLVNGLGLAMTISNRKGVVPADTTDVFKAGLAELSATDRAMLGLAEPRATDVFGKDAEPRATDALMQSLSKGIVASSRQGKK